MKRRGKCATAFPVELRSVRASTLAKRLLSEPLKENKQHQFNKKSRKPEAPKLSLSKKRKTAIGTKDTPATGFKKCRKIEITSTSFTPLHIEYENPDIDSTASVKNVTEAEEICTPSKMGKVAKGNTSYELHINKEKPVSKALSLKRKRHRNIKTSKSYPLSIKNTPLEPLPIEQLPNTLGNSNIYSTDCTNYFYKAKEVTPVSKKETTKPKKCNKSKSSNQLSLSKSNVKLAPIFMKQSYHIPKKCPAIKTNDGNDVELKSDVIYSKLDVCLPGCHIQQTSDEIILGHCEDWKTEIRELQLCIDIIKPHGWAGLLGITDISMHELLSSKSFSSKTYSDKVIVDTNNDSVNEKEVYVKRKKRNSSSKSRLSMKRRKKKQQVNTSDLSEIKNNILSSSNTSLMNNGESNVPMNLEVGNLEDNINWVEKYKPLKSEEIICNHEAVNQLKMWLNYWKNKGIETAKCTSAFKKETESSECDYELSNDSDIDVQNCIIVYGPSGSGKTSLVYCLAQELGFKVFEVNVSSDRSGRKVNKQLREATQSHHVEGKALPLDEIIELQAAKMSKWYSEKQRKNKIRSKRREIKEFFKAVPSKHSGIMKYGSSGANLASVSKRRSLKTTKNSHKSINSIRSFFNASLTNTEDCENEECYERSELDNIANVTSEQIEDIGKPPVVQGLSISSHSLILFDDVDIIFKEDEGFWSAVNTFLHTTKKPVVLTASSSLQGVRKNITQPHEIISLELPDVESLNSYLTNIFQKEQLNMNLENVSNVINHLACDVRKSLLHMQYWCKLVRRDALDSKNEICTTELELSGETDCKHCFHQVKTCLRPPASNFLKSCSCRKRDITYLAALNTQQHYIDYLNLIHINLAQLLPLPLTSLSLASFADTRINSSVYKENEIEQSKALTLHEQSVSLGSCLDSHKKSNQIDIKRNMITFYFRRKKDEVTCAIIDSLNSMADITDCISFSDLLIHPLKTNKRNCSANNYCYIDEDYPCFRSVITDTVYELGSMCLMQTHSQLQKIMEKVQDEPIASLMFPHERTRNQCLQEENLLFEMKLQNTLICHKEISNILPAVTHLQSKGISVDYLSTLRHICQFEALKQVNKLKRAGRFLHYLDSISLGTDDKLYNLLQK